MSKDMFSIRGKGEFCMSKKILIVAGTVVVAGVVVACALAKKRG